MDNGISPDLKEKLDIMFSNVIATGDYVWTPNSGQQPTELREVSGDSNDEYPTPRMAVNVEQLDSSSGSKRPTSSQPKRKVHKKNKAGVANKLVSKLDQLIEATTSMSTGSSSSNATAKAFETIDSIEEDCIGAIDGTPVHARIPQEKKAAYVGRCGSPIQNIMAVCDFNMCFTFAMSGWEGTAYDSKIFDRVLRDRSLGFQYPPQGKHYLVDSGYSLRHGFLKPYRDTRYHLPDFARANQTLCGYQEVFNQRHLSPRVLDAAGQRQSQDAKDEKSATPDNAKRDRLLPDICVICLEQEYNAVFVPCGHMCCCTNCSLPLNNCPLCRRRIDQVVKTFRH